MDIKEGYRVFHLTDGKEIPSVVKMIRRGKADGVNLNYIENFPPNINEFKKAERIKYLSVNDYSWDYDYSIINELSTLEVLNVYTTDRIEINFSNLPRLHSTALFWRPKASSLYECNNLKRLFLGMYTEKNLSKLEKLRSLEYLRINTGSVQTLEGISALESLKTLYLALATKLENISGIESLRNLELVFIDNCKRINNIELLKTLNKKVKLTIIGTTPTIDD